eukprot:NODE_8943_length_1458_cov_3.985725.p1 GENE.NODE_8943_length_1458_cov_3.985725~~NODE_8943_length_1458_cov_3.985725.p1  ORF type:complete len:448 (-),score=103.91 NODE_8943_length_1458_cov_3.985725:113-1354(-)
MREEAPCSAPLDDLHCGRRFAAASAMPQEGPCLASRDGLPSRSRATAAHTYGLHRLADEAGCNVQAANLGARPRLWEHSSQPPVAVPPPCTATPLLRHETAEAARLQTASTVEAPGPYVGAAVAKAREEALRLAEEFDDDEELERRAMMEMDNDDVFVDVTIGRPPLQPVRTTAPPASAPHASPRSAPAQAPAPVRHLAAASTAPASKLASGPSPPSAIAHVSPLQLPPPTLSRSRPRSLPALASPRAGALASPRAEATPMSMAPAMGRPPPLRTASPRGTPSAPLPAGLAGCAPPPRAPAPARTPARARSEGLARRDLLIDSVVSQIAARRPTPAASDARAHPCEAPDAHPPRRHRPSSVRPHAPASLPQLGRRPCDLQRRMPPSAQRITVERPPLHANTKGWRGKASTLYA